MGEGIEDPPPPQLSAVALTGAHCRGRTKQVSQIPQPRRSLVLCRASPLPPRPAPHLLRRLGVKVRLQQRDRELDLPGAVVLLHGWGGGRWAGAAAGGKAAGLGAGAGALALRSAPAPAPARRARLPAPCSALPARGPGDSAAADWLRTRPSRPPPPPPPPGTLTPSWLRRGLRGSPPRGRASRAWPGPRLGRRPRRASGCPQSSGQGVGVGSGTENFSRLGGQVLGAGRWRGAGRRRRQTREEDFVYDLARGCLIEQRREGDLGMQQEG